MYELMIEKDIPLPEKTLNDFSSPVKYFLGKIVPAMEIGDSVLIKGRSFETAKCWARRAENLDRDNKTRYEVRRTDDGARIWRIG